jgi:DNA-binding IclR family transcriptional regulator
MSCRVREPRHSPLAALKQRNSRRPEKLPRWRSRLARILEQGHAMQQRLHWLDYDPVAFAVLAVGMGMIALLALSI